MSEAKSNQYVSDKTPDVQYMPAHAPIEALHGALQEDGVVMAPGSAISVLGVTVHGAGANTTVDFCRRGLGIQYCVGWIRATHANLLLYPPDVARNLPVPVQRLLGYQLEAKHCGQLEQGVDPITLLRD